MDPVGWRARHGEVRPATAADVPSMAALQSHGFGNPSAGRAATLADELESAGRWLWVATACPDLAGQPRVVAFARLRLVDIGGGPPAGYYLGGVVVDPGYRGQGIGSELTRVRIEFGWAAGASALFYFSNVRNTASIALHERFGFREVERPFHFPGVEFDGGTGVLFRLDRPE